MKYNLKREWPLLLIIAATFLAAFLVYPHMPEQVPIHWNIHERLMTSIQTFRYLSSTC